MPSIRLAAAVLAVCAGLALAACGDDADESNDYVAAVNEVTSTLNGGLSEVASQGGGTGSPQQVSGVFEDFAGQLNTAAADLSAIEPPSDVEAEHDELVSILEELSAESENAANEVASGGPAAVVGVSTQYIGEATRLGSEADATIGEINAKLQG